MNTVITIRDPKYVLSVGLDWVDQTHAVCQRAWADGQRQVLAIGADPASVQAWLVELKALAGPQGRVALGFEQNRGALFEMLRPHTDWIDLYPLNPLTVSKYREAFFTSKAKDDPVDGRIAPSMTKTATSEPSKTAAHHSAKKSSPQCPKLKLFTCPD